jgi:hypothetical protein
MIVLPYLGTGAARRELVRPQPATQQDNASPPSANPLRALEMRLTYRTVCVLRSVAAHPGCSNREIALNADIHDQGQASRLLARLQRFGLVENRGAGALRGAPNAWTLTPAGREMEQAIAQRVG